MVSKNNELMINDSERKSIIDNSDLTEFSEELSGYKMNSEMKVAWIVDIIPPDSAHKKSMDDEVLIEFMLPDESTFWKSFDTPHKRWDINNKFIQLMISHNIYSPDNLIDLLGNTVDIKYNEIAHEWEPKIPTPDEAKTTNNSTTEPTTETTKRSVGEIRMQQFKIMASAVLFLIGFSFLVVFRQYGVPFTLLLFGFSYLFIKSYIQ